MKRIDTVKNKKMKDVKFVEVIDKSSVRIVFNNNQEIILKAQPEDFGYDAGIYIVKDGM